MSRQFIWTSESFATSEPLTQKWTFSWLQQQCNKFRIPTITIQIKHVNKQHVHKPSSQVWSMFKNQLNIANFAQLQFRSMSICLFSIKLTISVKKTVLPSLICQHVINGLQKFIVSISVCSTKFTLTSAMTVHRGREKTMEMLSRDTQDFISPLQWLPNSPDLNPADYAIWDKLQVRVYCTWNRDVNHLVERLEEQWSRFDFDAIILRGKDFVNTVYNWVQI